MPLSWQECEGFLYQGTASAVPLSLQKEAGFSP
ncbi:hypothetical protein ACP_1063 [Acidobacterium capsulatum ATCC 51196]|uniref:Uncharacterized protein n=1 Tax=Acidobacterium capsulatum (strain ATCC 51196 / DSM 11244 / BCRC 80197 / JCM 7670 / NBRC 15755 / NCIMB 13165 / 161) TaxID=240015 RepID=C1F436_ACIC5|nr:hypothetical protein ACP_1063 [Acidobacterium capsulatum ATCC 51196]